MQTQQKSFLVAASPLFLVIFLDGMGLGLFIPILNALLIDPSNHFLTHAVSAAMQNFLYGITICIFMICWFFGAAILGDLSDQIGRKPSLLVCLFGVFLGYLLSGFAVIFHSITLIILGRVIAGFTSGSQPIAQAAIIDLSSDEKKARNIGLILLSLSLGFVLGPVLGGLLSNHNLVNWFGFSTPLYFAAFISLLNACLLWISFNETFEMAAKKISIKPQHAIEIFIDAFKHQEIKFLSIIFFIFIFGWSSFFSFISMFLIKVYNFDTLHITLFMAVLGVGFGIGNGFLVDYCTRIFSLKNNTIGSLMLSAIIILLMLIVGNQTLFWLLTIPLASFISIANAALVTCCSNQVSSAQQGWVMGITGAIMALVFAIDALIGGVLATINVYLPLFLAVIGLAVASLLMIRFKENAKIIIAK